MTHLAQGHVLERRLPSRRVESENEVVPFFLPVRVLRRPEPAGEPRGQAAEQRTRGEALDDDVAAASVGLRERDAARGVRRRAEGGRREALRGVDLVMGRRRSALRLVISPGRRGGGRERWRRRRDWRRRDWRRPRRGRRRGGGRLWRGGLLGAPFLFPARGQSC